MIATRRILIPVLAALATAGCVDGGVRSTGYVEAGYPYSGWYDGYYGPIYDGYWGDNGYFYYRTRDGDRQYHRGDRAHFVNGQTAPTQRFQPIQGQVRGDQSVRAPHYPHHGDRRGN